MISGDVLQKLIHAAYTTFDHNQIIVAYIGGILLSGILAVWKPNRFSILLLLGFSVLAFGFEYDKHFVGALTRQTLQSIIDDPALHLRTQRYITTFLGEILPIFFYMVGWGLIYTGMFLGVKNISMNKENNKLKSLSSN